MWFRDGRRYRDGYGDDRWRRIGLPPAVPAAGPEPADKGTAVDARLARIGDLLGYVRVSTAAQDGAAQRARLEAAGAVRVFEDVISGKRFDRPGLMALIADARPGDRLGVVRLDRLGRSLKELLDTVEDLKARGIGLVSLEERLDTTTAAGELIFHVFGAIAHFERRLIAERTRDGLIAARARGRLPGRPKASVEAVEAALTLVASGLSVGQAAKRLGLGRSTLYRIVNERQIQS